MNDWWTGRRLARALRRAIREREELRSRPWEESFLHWARDGSLHGHLLPPSDGRRRVSTTSDGWCPAWADEVSRQYLPDV